MAADIQSIKLNARLSARLAYPGDLDSQLTWLANAFRAASGEQWEGSVETTQTSSEAGSHTFQYRGSTSEERASALREALVEVEALITARDAGTTARPSIAYLVPTF